MWCHLPEPVFGPLRQWVLIAPVSTSGIPRLVLAEVEGELTAHKLGYLPPRHGCPIGPMGPPVPLDSGDGLAASFEVAPPHRPVPSVQCPRRTAFAFARSWGHWTLDTTAYTSTVGALLGSHQGSGEEDEMLLLRLRELTAFLRRDSGRVHRDV